MAKVKFTDTYIRSLRPPEEGRLEVSDETVPGLRIRVTPKGKKSWMYEKRVKGGVKRKHDLGRYPDVSIKQARQLANTIQVEANAGIDRVSLRKANAEAEELERKSSISLNKLLEIYYQLHVSGLRTGTHRMGELRSVLKSSLDLPSKKITNQILQAAIDEEVAAGHLSKAHRVRAYFSHLSRFARARGYFAPYVGLDLQKVKAPPARERTPSVEEVRRIYYATFALGDLWGPLFRLIILTAQRKNEIAHLRWSEVDLERRRIVLEGTRTKNAKPHITHLSDPALEELKWLSACADEDADLIFTTTGKTPVSGFSKTKARLDRVLGPDFEPWRTHDLRSSFATIQSERQHKEAVVDRVLNHSASGSAPSVVARVYNRAELLEERRIALDDWAKVVTGEPESSHSGNVVRIA